MEKIDINKYVHFGINRVLYGKHYGDYITRFVIYNICADNLGINFSEIKDYINSVDIELSEEEITSFLEEKKREDNKYKPKENNSNKSKSQNFADNFMKKLTAQLLMNLVQPP